MIEKLTSEQEKQLIDFREDCLKIGLSTEMFDKNKAKVCVQNSYKDFLNTTPDNLVIWYCDSPMQFYFIKTLIANLGENLYANLRDKLYANLRANLRDNLGENLCEKLSENLCENLRAKLGANLRDNLHANLGENLSANLRDNLRDNLYDNLYANLREKLYANLRDKLREKLYANLREKLRANLRDNLRDNLCENLREKLGEKLRDNLSENLDETLRDNLDENLRDNLRENLYDNLYANLREKLYANLRDNLKYVPIELWGSLDIYWLSFYLFPQQYLNVKYDKEKSAQLNNLYELSKSCFWVYTFKNFACICNRPNIIKKKGIQLHSENSPAISFRDGWELYYLNGVNVKKEIVLTAWDKIPIDWFLNEENTEIKREILRKIGYERLIKECKGITLDKSGDYELIELNVNRPIKYKMLKMLNPSIKCWHVEPVPPDVKTVAECINIRNSGIKPAILC